MPKKKQVTVPVIFEKFVFSLGALIKERVAESVQAATRDFFDGHISRAQERAEKEPRKKRGRRERRKGSKKKKASTGKPAQK